MKGSEKQISWAESIRTNKTQSFVNNIAGGYDNFTECMNSDPGELAALRKSIIGVVENRYAAFWIDNRNNTFNDMLKTEYERNLNFFT